MKNVLLLFTGLLIAGVCSAQNTRFITIDAENMQPFSVVMGKKNASSSAAGHLVLANLTDSVISIQINFPQQRFKEHLFRVPAGSRDRGFQLKKTSDLTWALYDWQTMELIPPVVENKSVAEIPPGTEIRTDGFARMMAAVVNDSAILVHTVSKNALARKAGGAAALPVAENKPPAPVMVMKDTTTLVKTSTNQKDKPVISADSGLAIRPPAKDTAAALARTDLPAENAVVVARDTAQQKAISSLPVPDDKVRKEDSFIVVRKSAPDTAHTVSPNTAPVFVPLEPAAPVISKSVPPSSGAVIRKMFDNTGKEYRDIRYRDSSAAGVDTIMIKIDIEPDHVQKAMVVMEPEKPVVPKPLQTDTVTTRAADLKQPATTSEPAGPGVDSVQKAPVKLAMVNSDCRATASDNDLDKLRVKMLAETGVEERILLARKAFRAKCYYTRQIKALSELFFTDESRYQFLDAAYPYIVDTDNFKSLVSLLTDSYYINRFKAMVRIL